MAELALWKDSGVDIEQAKGPWYKSIGQGMGAALNVASASEAYVLESPLFRRQPELAGQIGLRQRRE